MNEIQLTEESGKSELHISSNSSWTLFEKIAELLERELNAMWVEKADGIDQRYWDLKIENEILTLHLEHYLGIIAFSNSKGLLSRARLVIANGNL